MGPIDFSGLFYAGIALGVAACLALGGLVWLIWWLLS